jgi:DNA-binding NtrC family response regulator
MIDVESPDVVLLDVILPEIDGMEVLRRMGPLAEELPVIMITRHHDDAIALETLGAGAFDYMAKPVDCVYLAQTVAAAVAYRRRTGRRGAQRTSTPRVKGYHERRHST